MSTVKSVGTLLANHIRSQSNDITNSVVGTIDVGGDADICGGLTVDGTTTLGGSLDVAGSVSIGGSATIQGNLTVNGIYTISGQTFENLHLSGITSFENDQFRVRDIGAKDLSTNFPSGMLWYDSAAKEVYRQITPYPSISGSSFYSGMDISLGNAQISGDIVFDEDIVIRSLSDNSSTRIGKNDGTITQVGNSVAIGNHIQDISQGSHTIAIGSDSGVGISGNSGQGSYSIAIGYRSGYDVTTSGSIILNASGSSLNAMNQGLFIMPLRNISGDFHESDFVPMFYNSGTGEIAYKE